MTKIETRARERERGWKRETVRKRERQTQRETGEKERDKYIEREKGEKERNSEQEKETNRENQHYSPHLFVSETHSPRVLDFVPGFIIWHQLQLQIAEVGHLVSCQRYHC